MTSELPDIAVAEILAGKITALKPGVLPAETARKCEDLLIDVVGLCVTARNEDYVKAALGGSDDDGPCTVIGHARTLTASGAAFVNGTSAHGEDFDDTFEGGPVHAGAVIVDVAIDQGGCAETIRATTHDEPIYEVDRVLNYAVPNMPAAVARTSTLSPGLMPAACRTAFGSVTCPLTVIVVVVMTRYYLFTRSNTKGR